MQHLIRVYTVFSDLSGPILRVIIVTGKNTGRQLREILAQVYFELFPLSDRKSAERLKARFTEIQAKSIAKNISELASSASRKTESNNLLHYNLFITWFIIKRFWI